MAEEPVADDQDVLEGPAGRSDVEHFGDRRQFAPVGQDLLHEIVEVLPTEPEVSGRIIACRCSMVITTGAATTAAAATAGAACNDASEGTPPPPDEGCLFCAFA